MTILYVMTFGLFSGFSAVFALLINNQFGDQSTLNLGVKGATYAFLGPLIGSLIRMSWGIFCDRMGGAIWTFISAVGMTITLGGIAWVLTNPTGKTDFNIFLGLMLAMFLFSGFGNAGTFKQMPMIMPARQAGGAIGFTAAIASLGPFLVGVALSAISAPVFFAGCAALLRPVRGPVLDHVRAQERPVPRLIHPALRGADGPATASSIDS